jgi:hypothetical protein
MPEDQRTPGTNVVDVRRPVRIHHVASFSRLDEAGISPHATEGPHRTIDPSRNHPLGPDKQCF